MAQLNVRGDRRGGSATPSIARRRAASAPRFDRDRLIARPPRRNGSAGHLGKSSVANKIAGRSGGKVSGRNLVIDDGSALETFERRALALWPRLDATALGRCHHDLRRIARLVARRTPLSEEAIIGMLMVPQVATDEIDTWFG